MTKHIKLALMIIGAGSIVYGALFAGQFKGLAANVSVTGTSTYVAVFDSNNGVTSYSDLSYISSTRIFSSNGVSSLQAVTFTNATGSALTLSTPMGVASGGTGTSTYNNGVVIASSSNAFTTIAPGPSGNVLTSNGSAWVSSAPSGSSNNSTPSSVAGTFTFGESVSAGEAVYMSDGTSKGKDFQLDTGHSLSSSLISYYPLDNANDFFSSNNLTNTGSVAFNGGKVTNAADFGASNTTKYLSVSSNLGVTGGNFSLSLWFNVTTAPGVGTTYILANQGDAGTNTGYLIWYQNSGGTKQIRWRRSKQGVSNDDVAFSVDVGTGNWHHVVLTYDGTNVEGWYDGVSKGVTASSGNGTSGVTSRFTIGSDAVGLGSNLHSGLVDEVGAWSKKLSNQEIADLYDSGTGQTMNPARSNGAAGQVYAASAADHIYSDSIIGFTTANVSANATGTVTLDGLVNNISGLVAGKQYYLANSSGTISTTAGSVVRKVGIAVSSSILEVTNMW